MLSGCSTIQAAPPHRALPTDAFIPCGELAYLPEEFLELAVEDQNAAVLRARLLDAGTLRTCEARRKRLENALKTYR
jgi:hypothetical protein